MHVTQVAVATISWARTTAEEALLGRSLHALAQHQLPLAVADRGTSVSFLEMVRGLER